MTKRTREHILKCHVYIMSRESLVSPFGTRESKHAESHDDWTGCGSSHFKRPERGVTKQNNTSGVRGLNGPSFNKDT